MSDIYNNFCETCRDLRLGVFISNINEITLHLIGTDSQNNFSLKRLFYTKPLKKYYLKNNYFNCYLLNSEKFDFLYKKFIKLNSKRNFKKHLNNILKYSI